MRTLARWCFRHRLVVVATWLIAVIACTAIQQGVGSSYPDNFSLPQTQSFQAMSLLERAAPRVDPATSTGWSSRPTAGASPTRRPRAAPRRCSRGSRGCRT